MTRVQPSLWRPAELWRFVRICTAGRGYVLCRKSQSELKSTKRAYREFANMSPLTKDALNDARRSGRSRSAQTTLSRFARPSSEYVSSSRFVVGGFAKTYFRGRLAFTDVTFTFRSPSFNVPRLVSPNGHRFCLHCLRCSAVSQCADLNVHAMNQQRDSCQQIRRFSR